MSKKPVQPAKSSDSPGYVGAGDLRSGRSVQTGLIQGATFGIKAVQYSIVEGVALFEGDIVLGTEPEIVAQTDVLRKVQSGQVESGVIITGSQFRWPNCTVPYNIDPTLPSQNRVTDAIAHWESLTRFRFVLRTAANAGSFPDWVTFRPSTGCSSSVGRQGGQQFVNLASGCTTGNAIHEIGHTVGLWHEQSRQDRDSFVTVHWNKIQPGLEHNFNQHITDGDDVGVYDYGSIMHYPRDAFSVDGSDTLTPVTTAAIGQRTALSAGDVAAANSLCPKTTKEVVKDIRFDTLKETVKDIRLDTKKELVLDTQKELVKERIKEAAKDQIKEVALDPVLKGPGDVINPVLPPVNPVLPGLTQLRPVGAVPFAMATAHQAPAAGAGDAPGLADAITQLDAQLQAIADALTQSEATRQMLQQQYDETTALLKQALAEHDKASGK